MWTLDDVNILKRGYADGIPISEIAKQVERRRVACSSKARRLGLIHPNAARQWTPEEESILRQGYITGRRLRVIASEVNHPQMSCQAKARELGLTKTYTNWKAQKELRKRGLKKCPICGEIKQLDEFYESFGARRMCKPCWKEYQHKNREKKKGNWKLFDAETTTKQCTICGRILPIKDFQVNVGGKFGRSAKCRSCAAAKRKKYRTTLRLKALSYLDPNIKCNNCSFSDIRALHIDHIFGKQDNDNFCGAELCRYILSLPAVVARSRYQILCVNCNNLKEHPTSPSTSAQVCKKALLYLGEGNPVCISCEEDNLQILQIDHIHGGGRKEKLRFGGAATFYSSLLKVPLSETKSKYQILCGNCNWIKRVENGELGESQAIDR